MAKRLLNTSTQMLSMSLIATLLLMGCHNDSDGFQFPSPSPSTPETPTNPEQDRGTLIGTVVDQESLEPIANATITVADEQYQSSADGTFELTELTVGEPVTLNINAADYPERTFTTTLSGTAPMQVEYQLSNDATIASVVQPVSESIDLTIAEMGAKVSIPANALQRADGKAIVGNVIVSMDVVTPSIDPEEMPGGYEIVDGGFMESFGAVIITATDSEDAPLVLADGNTASLVIPVSTRSTEALSEKIPLFFYDSANEGWVQTGEATLQTLADGVQVYTAEVNEIGAWNVDVAMDTVNVLGCVADIDGNRIDAALVKGDGINYSAITTTLTDSNGNFVLPARRDGELYVYAQNGNRTTNAQPITTAATDYNIEGDCLKVSTGNDSLSIRLTWGELPYDVDSHLVTPSGDHIYFSNEGSLSSAPFANLDVDDTLSYGPEFITVRKLMVGRYHYGVHNYSRTKPPGLKDSPITVFLEGPTIRSRTLTPSTSDADNSSLFWHAFDLVVDEDCKITYESVDSWLNTQETGDTFEYTTTTSPQYCVAP